MFFSFFSFFFLISFCPTIINFPTNDSYYLNPWSDDFWDFDDYDHHIELPELRSTATLTLANEYFKRPPYM